MRPPRHASFGAVQNGIARQRLAEHVHECWIAGQKCAGFVRRAAERGIQSAQCFPRRLVCPSRIKITRRRSARAIASAARIACVVSCKLR